jgi:prepilin-type N-terminal cleavage/methylation domain-containing protein
MARTRPHSDEGVTLIELVAVLAIMGVLAAISFPTWTNYQSKQRLVSSTRDVVSLLRHAQASAVANSSTTRVDIAADGKSLTESLLSPSSVYNQTGQVTLASGITVSTYAFTARTGGTSTSVYFYSRGTATDGSITLRRTEGSTRRVTVEGVTGRVAYS